MVCEKYFDINLHYKKCFIHLHPLLRRRVDWRVGEIVFRLWAEREEETEKAGKIISHFLERMAENNNFVVPKVNKPRGGFSEDAEVRFPLVKWDKVLWNYEVATRRDMESRRENLLVYRMRDRIGFCKRHKIIFTMKSLILAQDER